MTDVEDKILALEDEIRTYTDSYSHEVIKDIEDVRFVRFKKLVAGELLQYQQGLNAYELKRASCPREYYYEFLKWMLFDFKGFVEDREAMRK